jgi:hypothetical protein
VAPVSHTEPLELVALGHARDTERADHQRHRPQPVERREGRGGSRPSSRCSIAAGRSSPRRTSLSTTARSSRAKKRRSR